MIAAAPLMDVASGQVSACVGAAGREPVLRRLQDGAPVGRVSVVALLIPIAAGTVRRL